MSGMPAYRTSVLLKEKFGLDFDPQEFANKEYHFLQNIYKAEPIKPVIKIIRNIPESMACGNGRHQVLCKKTLNFAVV